MGGVLVWFFGDNLMDRMPGEAVAIFAFVRGLLAHPVVHILLDYLRSESRV